MKIVSDNLIIESDRKRSLTSMFFCLIVAVFSVGAVLFGLNQHVSHFEEYNLGFKYLTMFTVLSNLFAMVVDFILLSFFIEGFRKRRCRIPRWAIVLLFSSTLSVTITFLVSVAIILPVTGITAITGSNFWLHLTTPILNIIFFIFIQSERLLVVKDIILASIPYETYLVAYFIMVYIIGEENGGWVDYYRIKEFFPWYIAILIFPCASFIFAFPLMLCHNAVTRRKYAKNIKMVTDLESKMSAKDVYNNVFDMGKTSQEFGNKYELVVPLDTLKIAAENNESIDLDELVNSYVNGALDCVKNQENKYK